MQDYNPIQPTGLISADRAKINNNIESVMSHFSGNSFPTTNLHEGMYCWRSDLKRMYQLNADLVNWTLVNDMSQGYNSVAHSSRADYATKDEDGNPIKDTYYKQASLDDLKKALFPIGSVYITMTNTNPSTFLGGTWQQIAGGRTLIGASASYVAGTQGGSETESYTPTGSIGSTTLTVSQIPAHNHSASTSSAGNHTHTYMTPQRPGEYNDEGKYGGVTWNIDVSKTYDTGSAGNHTHTVSVGNTGGSQGHTHTYTGAEKTISHMQPYLVCYFWQKVAD